LELEDLTGTIPIHLSKETQVDKSGVYCERGLVVVQGQYQQGTFVVDRLGLPPLETKAQSQPYVPPNPMIDNKSSPTTAPLTIYSMSNVALDQPEVVEQLEDLLERMNKDHAAQQKSNDSLLLLVLMGNFTTESMTLLTALDELARLLEGVEHSVVIVPGPNDSPSACWPFPAMKSHTLLQNDHVSLASNPCRLHYGTKEICLLRHDVVRDLVPHQVFVVPSEKPLVQRVVHTLLSQGNMLLPHAAPIYWNYDHAMSLYPLPDLLLLGGTEHHQEEVDYSKAQCQVVAPGAGGWAKVTIHGGGKQRKQHPLKVEYSQDFEEDSDKEDGI
jgi:DNA polymerase epsilon subunit 2